MLYNSTGNLPTYNFDKILRNNDYRYLVIGWNERDEIEQPEEGKEVWNSIYEEYCKKTENNEALSYYALYNEVSYLETKLTVIIALIEGITEANKKDFGREINAWGIPFNIDGNVLDQLPLLKRHLKGLKQKYDIRLHKLENMKKDEEPISILKQKIRLERITGLKIDLRTCVVDEWIEINKEAVEIAEAQRRNG